MLKPRIIPQLLLSDNQLVKTTSFKEPKYVGDPVNIIRIFNEKKVDEIILLDINASTKDKINFKILEKISGECFMPICYGGGIKTFEDAKTIFSLGFEKIALNQALLNNINLITKISEVFGSQSVVASINIKKNILRNQFIYDYVNKKKTNIKPVELIKKSIENGCGEILINFVENDGKLCGLQKTDYINLDLINFDVPIILSGGINSIENIEQIFSHNISAISAGAFFIYHGPHRAVLISYPKLND